MHILSTSGILQTGATHSTNVTATVVSGTQIMSVASTAGANETQQTVCSHNAVPKRGTFFKSD